MKPNPSNMSLHPEESRFNNDIKEIRNERQLEKVNLDFDSPRLKKAMDDLGIPLYECLKKDKSAFEKKGVEPAVIELRYKHY
jgi:hypothetical protein